MGVLLLAGGRATVSLILGRTRLNRRGGGARSRQGAHGPLSERRAVGQVVEAGRVHWWENALPIQGWARWGESAGGSIWGRGIQGG